MYIYTSILHKVHIFYFPATLSQTETAMPRIMMIYSAHSLSSSSHIRIPRVFLLYTTWPNSPKKIYICINGSAGLGWTGTLPTRQKSESQAMTAAQSVARRVAKPAKHVDGWRVDGWFTHTHAHIHTYVLHKGKMFEHKTGEWADG